jgi:protein-S-isoprenylcysteine O-methyltransferase Ste14
MSFTDSFDLSFSGGIWFAVIYLLISTSLTLMLPKYRLPVFMNVPDVKIFSFLYRALYYLQLLLLCFLDFTESEYLLYAGIAVYILGILFYASAMFFFATAEYHRPVTRGLYKFSRHPVYLSFFIIILGATIATGNLILLIMNVLYVIVSRKIAKAEELDCQERYGTEYKKYAKNVKRFII